MKMAPKDVVGQVRCRCGLGRVARSVVAKNESVHMFCDPLCVQLTSFFSSVVERGIAAMQVILRSLFRSREGAVLLLTFCPSPAFQYSWFHFVG
jgi:hypothetical protein